MAPHCALPPLPAALPVLALCSALVAASRTDSHDVKHASACEGNSSLGVRAGAGVPGRTKCACFLKEWTLTAEEALDPANVADKKVDPVKVGVMESMESSRFKSAEECHEGCPRECHKLSTKSEITLERVDKFRFTHFNLEEGRSVPMIGSKCKGHECSCLDAVATTAGLKEYSDERPLKGKYVYKYDRPPPTDLVAFQSKMYESSEECLKVMCECDEVPGVGPGREYDSLCVSQFHWAWALYDSGPGCYWDKVPTICPYLQHDCVGLSSCSFAQHFELNKGDSVYKVQLKKLREYKGNREHGKIIDRVKLNVAEAKISKMSEFSFHKQVTSDARMQTWAFKKSNPLQQIWKVLGAESKETFTIERKTWTNDKVWRVKTDKTELYYAHGTKFSRCEEDEDEPWIDEDDELPIFTYCFYQTNDKTGYAGWVAQDSKQRFSVNVKHGEHAGLLLITSVILGEVYG